MRENIATIGVKFDGTDLESGKASLDAIAAAGRKGEALLQTVEDAAVASGRTLASLEQDSRVARAAVSGCGREGFLLPGQIPWPACCAGWPTVARCCRARLSSRRRSTGEKAVSV